MTMAVFTVLLMVLGATGYGALTLRMLKLNGQLRFSDDLAYSSVIGHGLLGWLAFVWLWQGWVEPSHFIILCMLGVPLLVFLKQTSHTIEPFNGWERVLLLGLAAAFGLDLIESLAPLADADTIAYHFELPRRFIENGGLFFVPRAVDGAVPMLIQSTYSVALGIAGEQAGKFWALVSGWMTIGLLYTVSRHFLTRPYIIPCPDFRDHTSHRLRGRHRTGGNSHGGLCLGRRQRLCACP